MDKLKALKTFCHVVETQSFTKTAQKMALSKAAISKHIRELEAALDLSLVKRTTRGISITESGRVYYERVSHLLKELMVADDEAKQYEKNTSGHIKLSVPVSMGLLFITPILPMFMEEYPDISIEVVLSDDYANIIQEGFDLLIRGTKKMPDSNLRSRKIGEFTHIVCASPEYIKQYGAPRTPSDLVHHRLLVYTGVSMPEKWSFIDQVSNKDEVVQIVGHYRSNNSLALKQAVMQNKGLLRVPNIYVQDELISGELVTVLNEYTADSSSIFVLYSDSYALPHRVRILIDWLVLHFNIR